MLFIEVPLNGINLIRNKRLLANNKSFKSSQNKFMSTLLSAAEDVNQSL